MKWWPRVRIRHRLDDQVDHELRDHMERLTADDLGAGMLKSDAGRRARQLKEMCRQALGTRWASDAGQDLRCAVRLLWRDRWFTLAAAFVLALGIGMNGTMFTIVNAMIRGLPTANPERLLSIHARDCAGRLRDVGVSYLD